MSLYDLCMIRAANNRRTIGRRTNRAATTSRTFHTLALVSSPEQEREICARIKRARIEAGLTQDEFADLLKVEKRTVQNYELDRVPWRYLKDISKITGRAQEWLLRGDVFDLSQMDRIEQLLKAIAQALGLESVSPAEQAAQAAEEAAQATAKRQPASARKRAATRKKSANG